MGSSMTAEMRTEQAVAAMNKALRRLDVQSGKAVTAWLPKEAALLARYVGSLTPPFDGFHPGRMTRGDMLVGKKAIRADLLGRQRGQGIVKIATREEIVRARDFYGEIMRRTSVPMGWEGSRAVAAYNEYYDPDGVTLKQVHRANRRRSDGRVSQANRLKQVGVWKVTDQVWVTEFAFERYLKEPQKRVGRGKKGWYLAGRLYGGDTGWPAWVRKAPGESGGGTVNGVMRKEDPFVRLFNSTHVARRADTQTAIRRALRERSKRLVRGLDAELRKRVRGTLS